LEAYIATLLDSELPFDAWAATLTWVALFVANHWVARIARAANDAQKLVVVEDWSAVRRGFEPKYMLVQILVASSVFMFGFFLGRLAFTFLAGGLIVARMCALSLNVQSVFLARSMADPGAGKGAVILSTPLALRQVSQRLGGSALSCLLAGLALAHLALLGGALLLASHAAAYSRRAQRHARAQA
jgi:hypothetical protein